MKNIGLFLLFITSVTPGQEPVLRWLEFHPPAYPRLAKLARIQGEARVEIKLNPVGKIVALRPVSGRPLLVQAAMESLQQSRLTCENCAGKSVVFMIAFNFKFGDGLPCEGSQAALISANHVTLTTGNPCVTHEDTGPHD